MSIADIRLAGEATMERRMAAALDAWITREPDWRDPEADPPVHCGTCGQFTIQVPYHTVTFEDGPDCDGIPTETEWGERVASCGDTEVHEPHLEPMVSVAARYFRCHRGHVTRIVEVA